MLRKISIRLRLTLLTIVLLTLCCIGLTIILNLSANRMANTIEASVLTPSIKVPANSYSEIEEPILGIVPSSPNVNSQTARDNFHQQGQPHLVMH